MTVMNKVVRSLIERKNNMMDACRECEKKKMHSDAGGREKKNKE